jgi:hypothetical protein
MKASTRVILLLLMSLVFFYENAHAYIDPGTGSYFFQLLIGALLAAGFAIKIYWSKLKKAAAGLFKPKDKGKADDAD